jgi:hypothetical protein
MVGWHFSRAYLNRKEVKKSFYKKLFCQPVTEVELERLERALRARSL